MPSHESTLGPARLHFASEAEVDHFVAQLGRFERGEIGADEWRSFRLVHGTYGQRQEGDLSMVRVKIPQGVLSAEQAVAIAEATERWSRGFCHLTTRQNVQMHFVRLHDVGPLMQHLAAAGLTTREACGNSVRNITCAPGAGVAADEPFDTTPYARALTRYLLRHPLASTLPRKFKIAFAGGGDDHAYALINDIGFWPQLVGGARTFRVTVGGGTATLCRAGSALVEALPAGEILALAEAVLRVFHARGDRVHRHKNRMKFLVREIGWPEFVALVEAELAAIRAAGVPPLPFAPGHPPDDAAAPAERPREPSLAELSAIVAGTRLGEPGPLAVLPVTGTEEELASRWRRTSVRPQRQAGYSQVRVTLPLGDVSSAQLRALALLSRSFGDGTLRTTHGQDLELRWVPDERIAALGQSLAVIGLGRGDADTVLDVGSCPGAESCKLAVTRSRGAAQLVNDHFSGQPALVDALGRLDVRVSGCPNGCGLHHVAAIGLQGAVRKLGGRAVPQYFVLAGGDPRPDHGGSFGRVAAKVPARRVGLAIERLARHYLERRRPGEDAARFFARVDLAQLKLLLRDLEELGPEAARAEDFIDLGEAQPFRPETTDGECVA